jgi:hypothetical protein
MHIDDGRPGRTRTGGDETCSGATRPAVTAIQRAGSLESGDRVEAPGAGRARALSDLAGTRRGALLTPARVAELRERIANGFYDTPKVLDRVARRILDSGELGRDCGEAER